MNQQNQQIIKQNYTANPSDAGLRIDQFLSSKFPEFSRGVVQQWILSGDVLVNNRKCKAKNKLNDLKTL